jgi:hypothetical protein
LHVDDARGAESLCEGETGGVGGGAGNDGLDAVVHEHEQTEQADGAGAGNEGDVAGAHIGDFGDGVDGGGERLDERAFLLGQALVETEKLVGAHAGVAREGAVDTVAHAAPIGAEHEVAATAPAAMAACDGGRAEDGVTGGAINLSAHGGALLDDATDEFVTENHRREISERVVQHVHIGAADAAGGDFEFDLVVCGDGFGHIA